MLSWPWDEIGILVLGLPAIWFMTYKQFLIRRWGYLLALLSEVFWIWTCVKHQQWFILASVLVYTFIWGRGFWVHWIQKRDKE